MAYEYGSGGKELNLPNPLKIHNLFLAGASGFLGICAIVVLFAMRAALVKHQGAAVVAVLILAFVLVGAALSYGAGCLSQLKFYFGRSRPVGLAPELSGKPAPVSEQANTLKETLRQQALAYEEPVGAIQGALYSLAPNLIFAPKPLRYLAVRQLRNGLIMLSLLLSLSLSLMLSVPGTQSYVVEDIAWAFLAVAILILLKPGDMNKAKSDDLLSIPLISLLIVGAFALPVALTLWAPPLPQSPVSPFPHVFFLLLLGIATYALFFVALLRQIQPPPATAVSVVQDKWNMAANPALVIGEFDRVMQELWPEGIPNRRYIRREPQITLNVASGAFSGEMLEETQPFPSMATPIDFVTALREKPYQLTLALDILATVFIVGGGFAACNLAFSLLKGEPSVTAFVYMLILSALGRYAFWAAHRLWLRFDFLSRLVWLEMDGQYVASKVDQGNVIEGTLRTSSEVVQVEGMTFRLWVAEIHSITFGKFGKDSQRSIYAMVGNPGLAETLAREFKTFATSQASIAAIGNEANLQRIAAMTALSQAGESIAAKLPRARRTKIAAVPPEDNEAGQG